MTALITNLKRGNVLTGKATTMRDDFAFNSMVEFAGKFLMANSDGIFEFGGDTDNGEEIIPVFETPVIDMTTPVCIDFIYTGAAEIENNMTVTSIVDDVENSPVVLNEDDTPVAHVRTRLAKGALGRFWKLRFTDPLGGKFVISKIQGLIRPSSRAFHVKTV